MLPREIVPPPAHVYPPEDWRIVESRFDRSYVARAETMFALSNGFLGMRGTYEEGRPRLSSGTFVNGFHETWPILHAEEAYGLARLGQTIVNVPDPTVLKLYVDDEPLYLPTARLQEYERALDMRTGVLTRQLVWSTPSGKHIRIRSRRLVSFEHRHVFALEYEVEPLDVHAPIVLSSELVNWQDADGFAARVGEQPSDPRLAKQFAERVLNADVLRDQELRQVLGYHTTNSGMSLGVGVDHAVTTDATHRTDTAIHGDSSRVVVMADGEPGVPIRITKVAAYQASRNAPPAELADRCELTLDRVVADGFETLIEHQREHMDRFWERADIRVDAGDDTPRMQQAVRWNLFQLVQASWRAEGTGIPAKGLTGQAYEGHYFWDTEVYVLPFLAYTQPRIARNLLRFRHSMLDAARTRASTVGQRGALFPWRTINGEEASAYYQAGTAQYHINADIAYAIRKYIDVRGDVDFLTEVGAEVLVESARMWEDLGFHGDDGYFHIHGVTGPDEYTTVVNDNAYTNLMARLNLNFAVSAIRRLEAERPAAYAALVHDLRVAPDEVERWRLAAESMYVPYDPERRINPQDETFLEREVWDLEGTPRDRFPLLLHFHPLVIYRFQVLKQADVVLAMLLLGNEFSREQKRRNFDYYDPLTTGDSSLSACMQSIVAAEVGRQDKALEYFDYALMMDLGDVAGNVSDGVHIASSGGVWQALVFGFGGVRDFDGELSFDPHLPEVWASLTFSVRFRDRQIDVHLTHHRETVTMREGDPLDMTMRGKPHRLAVDAPLVVDRT